MFQKGVLHFFLIQIYTRILSSKLSEVELKDKNKLLA